MRKRKAGVALLALAALALLWREEPPAPPELDPESTPELDALVGAYQRKLALKEAVFDGLIGGRLSLPAAVALCEKIEGEFPEVAESFRRGLQAGQPGRTFRERLARSVVANCAAILHNRAVPDDAALARLHEGLRALLADERPASADD